LRILERHPSTIAARGREVNRPASALVKA
jgi:hypothetical protein